MQTNKITALLFCAIIAVSSVSCGSREWPPTEDDFSVSIGENSSSNSGTENDFNHADASTTTAKSTTTKAVTTVTTKSITTTSSSSTTSTTTKEITTTTTSNNIPQANGLSFNITQTNSWEADGQTVFQFECIINNATENAITSWSIEIPVGDASLLQGWSANYNVSEGLLNISPDEFNTEIAANGTFSLGFQLSTNGNIDTSQAKLYTNGSSISPTQ